MGLVAAWAAARRGDLLAELPGFGQPLGYDGKMLPAHATGQTCPASGQPDKAWFGYGLHVIADTVHEIPVAWRLTRASASEVKTLEGPWDTWRSRALIPTRRLWREERTDAAVGSGAAAVEPPTRTLDPRRADTVMYDTVMYK